MAVDRLAALMLVITAVMGIACRLAAGDEGSRRFDALLQFQLAGLNGAFLTADLFNLFVFFEVLLAASYALLLDAQGAARLRAGLHYVTVNLLGSSLFLIAAAMFYGIAGTLNIADLDARLAALPASDVALAQVAGLLLLAVFAIKAAALPLGFWLPGTYGAATVHVAVLFAIMTKVGIYSILRVHGALFEAAPQTASAVLPLAGLALPWLLSAGLATLLLGAAGALAARDLRVLVAWSVVVSAGSRRSGSAPCRRPPRRSTTCPTRPSPRVRRSSPSRSSRAGGPAHRRRSPPTTGSTPRDRYATPPGSPRSSS
jgi:multicomponent K+:H+ antiporter subunit D